MHNFKLQSSNRNENITHTKSEQQEEEEMKNKQTNEKKTAKVVSCFSRLFPFSLSLARTLAVCALFLFCTNES